VDRAHDPDDLHADDLHPAAPDTFALRRRVLLTALVAVGLYVLALVLIESVGAPTWAALVAAALIYLFVVRPMMQPVREAIALRRRLAYLAWLEQREGADGPEPGRG
jgi:hypothetical protein